MHRWIAVLIAAGVLSMASPALPQQAQRTKVTFTAVSVLVSSTAALANNDNRNFLMLQNDHATQVVYCTTAATAVANTGFRINAAGGTLMFTTVPLGALACISVGGTSVLLVTEGATQ